MQVSKFLLLLLVMCGYIGCNKPLDAPRYVKWVEDEKHGLKRVAEIGDYKIQLQYKPVQYIVAKEVKRNSLSKDSIDKRIREIEGMQYYDLTIDIKDANIPLPEYGAKNSEEHHAKLNYYMYGFKDDVFLKEGNRTLPCRLFHFERTFNLTKHSTFVLAFDQDAMYKDSTKVLIIESPDLSVGTVRLEISKNDLTSIPNINL